MNGTSGRASAARKRNCPSDISAGMRPANAESSKPTTLSSLTFWNDTRVRPGNCTSSKGSAEQ